jgi:hypothetical protein
VPEINRNCLDIFVWALNNDWSAHRETNLVWLELYGHKVLNISEKMSAMSVNEMAMENVRALHENCLCVVRGLAGDTTFCQSP